MTIRGKQFLFCALGLAPMVAITAVSFWGLDAADPKKSDLATMGSSLRYQVIADMLHDAIRGDALAALVATDPKDQEQVVKDYEEHAASLREAFRKNLELHLPVAVRTAIAEEAPRLERYSRTAGELIHLANRDRSAATAGLPAFVAQFREAEGSMDQLNDLVEQSMSAVQEGASRSLAVSKMILLVTGVAAILALSAAAIWISGSINRGLFEGIRAMKLVASQLATSSAEIASSSQSLAQGASEGAASLEQTSASSEEINAMARKNAQSAESAAALVSQSQQNSSVTTQSIEKMVGAMAEVTASSDRISKIIKVIDEIAFQTNILALNAAVEAARAGGAGVSFAVVAEEVRNLAHRCAQAASETAVLIEESIVKSNEGKAQVDQVAAAVRAITADSAKLKTLVDEVSTGSVEQTRGIEQVARAIVHMEKVTQSTAASAEENAAASETLTAESKGLEEAIERLAAMVGGTDRVG